MANSRKAGDSANGRPRRLPLNIAPAAQPAIREYRPQGKKLIEFLKDRRLVEILCGPLGSAKTIALLHKVHILMQEAAPSPDGLRRSRVIIVRNTYSDLVTTTMAKWREWWPEEEYGRIKLEKPPMLRWQHGDIDAEIWFLALDQQDDVKKLRSLEPSIVVFNELQYIARDIFDEATSRVGRYPADVPFEKRQKFVLADMNAPEEGHWTAVTLGLVPAPDHLTEMERKQLMQPEGWGIFIQPPAVVPIYEADRKTVKQYVVNPEAENLRYLGPDYYKDMLAGKTKEWIENRLMVKVGSVLNGAAVWPMFQLDRHVGKEKLQWLPSQTLYVGLDFGRTPAAIVCQAYNGKIFALSEVYREGMSAEVFAPILKRFLAQRYPNADDIQMWGDPSGGFGNQANETTPFKIFRAHGMVVMAARTPGQNENDAVIRVDAVVKVLNEDRFVMDPTGCPMLKGAMLGGYKYSKVRGTDIEKPAPEKNRFSHMAEAFGYLCIGLGEGRSLLRGSREPAQPVQTALYRRAQNVVALPGVRRFGRR